ncbi:MAG: glycosyltransferase family 9 protein [Deltaproteobacteria bacterium]|nr:glycosyltransferase family 9 protein [Deltaproteobacteria bacterium]
MSLKNGILFNLAGYFHKKIARHCRPAAPLASVPFGKILVLSTTAIGDTLLSTPVLAALRHEFPEAAIKVLVQKKFMPLFADNPHVDGFVGFQKGMFHFFRTALALKRERFQLALVLHVSDPLPVYMAVLAQIPLLAGYPPEPALRPFFSHPVEPPHAKHVIAHRMAVLEAVRPQLPGWSPRLVLPVRPERVREVVGKYLPGGGAVSGQATLIGFQPGASKRFKMWPLESFVQLGRQLLDRDENIMILVLGSREERALGDDIVRGIGRGERTLSLCGRLPLEELPPMVAALRGLVTNDTGTMHIAVALGTPAVCLFVPTDPLGIGPIQDMEIHQVISRPRPCGEECVTKKCRREPSCMSLLGVDEVLAATLRVLAG